MTKSPRRNTLIEVRHSPIHGYGVFATRRIRKGTTVIEYLGDRVTHDEADSRYENKDPNDNHTFLFTVDSKTVIDGGVGGNEARYINHGCDPNCESTTMDKRIYIEAIRTIQPGDELAYDYQIQRDPEDAPNVDEVFACLCGAEKCRGSMLAAAKKPRKTAGKEAMSKGTKTRAAARDGGRKATRKTTRKALRKPAAKTTYRKAAARGRTARKTVTKSATRRGGRNKAVKKRGARTVG